MFQRRQDADLRLYHVTNLVRDFFGKPRSSLNCQLARDRPDYHVLIESRVCSLNLDEQSSL